MVATRCTVILTCLNAHEFVRRQLLHLDRVIGGKLASLVRVVLLDDGSQVPIPEYSYPWLTQIWTHDTRHGQPTVPICCSPTSIISYRATLLTTPRDSPVSLPCSAGGEQASTRTDVS